MKKFVMASAVAALAISSTVALAGGLNEAVAEEVVEKTNRSGILLPLLLLVAVAAAASSTSGTTSGS